MVVACVTCFLCLLTDGNTVTCCENNGVKDQNGNELRLCSAIDEERVKADEEKKKNIATKIYVCKIDRQYETSKGYRWKSSESWGCFNDNNENLTSQFCSISIVHGLPQSSCKGKSYWEICPGAIVQPKGLVKIGVNGDKYYQGNEKACTLLNN